MIKQTNVNELRSNRFVWFSIEGNETVSIDPQKIEDIFSEIDALNDNELNIQYKEYLAKLEKIKTKGNLPEEKKADFNERYLFILSMKFDNEFSNLYKTRTNSNGHKEQVFGQELDMVKLDSLTGFNKFKLEELLKSIIQTYEETNIRSLKSYYTRAQEVQNYLTSSHQEK
jgi:hypothetical protein